MHPLYTFFLSQIKCNEFSCCNAFSSVFYCDYYQLASTAGTSTSSDIDVDGARTKRRKIESDDTTRLRMHDHFSSLSLVELANLVLDTPVLKASAKQFFAGEYNGTLSLSYGDVKKRLDYETVLRVFGDQCDHVELHMAKLRFSSMNALNILAKNCANVHHLKLTECNLLLSPGSVVKRFLGQLSVLIIHKCIIAHGNAKINAAAMYTTDTDDGCAWS